MRMRRCIRRRTMERMDIQLFDSRDFLWMDIEKKKKPCRQKILSTGLAPAKVLYSFAL